MWTIEQTPAGWAVVKPGKSWARGVGWALVGLYALLVLGGAAMMSPREGFILLFLFSVPLALPGVLLLTLLARDKRYAVRALIETRVISGGVLVTVFDTSGVRREALTDAATADSLAAALAAPSA